VLAVGREGHVLLAQRTTRTYLGRLLPQQAGPDAELALALEGGRLGVELADGDEIAVEAAQLVIGEVNGIARVRHPLAVGGE
jgi:hypothetical protein